MNFIDWLKKWKLDKLKINAKFLEVELSFTNADKRAAWELYVELLTRVSTQILDSHGGDEKQALQSVYSLFPLTRDILRKNGPDCFEFTKIAVVVLNQIVRPFTTKWHTKIQQPVTEDSIILFREELYSLQKKLINYTQLLSDMAGVEDLTGIEN